MWTRASEGRRWAGLPLVLALLVGFGLRCVLLDRYPLREDEAIYSVWARAAWPADPFYLSIWPDKPPLFLWTLAAAFKLFGSSAAAARWVSIAASTLTIGVVGATGRQLGGERAGQAAAFAYALSPFAVAFAPTAYTDSLLVLCGSLALYLAGAGRWTAAGAWLAAAAMTKQQGVLYAPLVLGVAGACRSKPLRSRLVRLAVGAALVAGPVLVWDALRWAVAPSPWALGSANYGALALLGPAAWGERAAAWGPLLWHLVGSTALWLTGGVLALWALTRGKGGSRNNRAAWLMVVWALGFAGLHIISSVQAWDRYLLPLAPAVALGWAWAASAAAERLPGQVWPGALAALGLALLLPAWGAAQGRTPIGGDHGAYAGLEESIAWVQQAGPESVVYQRELGWQLQFYLYDEAAAGKQRLRWFSHGVKLADDAEKLPHLEKYYLQPLWGPVRDLELHLAARQLEAHERARFDQIRVVEIVRQPRPFCAWCVCAAEQTGSEALPFDGGFAMMEGAATPGGPAWTPVSGLDGGR